MRSGGRSALGPGTCGPQAGARPGRELRPGLLGRAGLERGLRIVLDKELNDFCGVLAGELRCDREREIYAGGNPAARYSIAVANDALCDDLLHHSIEAFTGMPDVFFTWASRTRKRVHFEFLDNSVAKGEQPRTVAFGWNGEMNVLDVKALIDVDRYKKIEIDARNPDDVYDPGRMAARDNTEFLKRCARLLARVNFADQRTGVVCARLKAGHWTIRDRERFEAAHTLGAWGEGG